MHDGLVFNLQRYSVQDGPGIRTTVFLKGCPLECWWCHNPESQAPGPEISFLEARCIGCGACRAACPQSGNRGNGRDSATERNRCLVCGACVAVCPSQARQMIGRRMSVDEVMAEVLRDRIFYDDSGGGVTFSGGEPLLQFGFLRALLLACRREEIHTAVDTCGYAPLEELLAIAPLVDLFLYDVKAIDNRLHIQHAGVSNDLILGNLRRLGWAHENLWVRVPVVPGFNDDEDELQAIARLAAEIPGVRKVELLPYHQTGGHKRAALRVPLPRQAEDLPRPT